MIVVSVGRDRRPPEVLVRRAGHLRESLSRPRHQYQARYLAFRSGWLAFRKLRMLRNSFFSHAAQMKVSGSSDPITAIVSSASTVVAPDG